MDHVFAPFGESWQPVSRKLATLRTVLLFVIVGMLTLIAVALLGWLIGWQWAAIPAALALIALAWGLWLIPRNWRAWGYAEREEDLLVKHGVLFRKLSVVPYGRMQFVDVSSGPLERRIGLATVQLHTASPATDARIPGLQPDEAARLRDRLAALGQARAAGL